MYKIYQIINIDGERYVGSTKQKLQRRYKQHNTSMNNPNIKRQCTSKNVLSKPNTILFIENTTKEQVLHRERYWIEKLSNVVNKVRPVINEEEGIIKAKKWRQERIKYQKTWGDSIDKLNRDTPNNLLLIDVKLFEK
jgi:predicted GIY-YIG superfamily endonuclease